jgi:hypothetical protein
MTALMAANKRITDALGASGFEPGEGLPVLHRGAR